MITDSNKKLPTSGARAAEIFGPLDVDEDGEITMDEFVEGYMKIHTTSNGKRRWSRKISMLQDVSDNDLEELRVKMDSVIGSNDDNAKDKITENENKDAENPPKEEKEKKDDEKAEKANVDEQDAVGDGKNPEDKT